MARTFEQMFKDSKHILMHLRATQTMVENFTKNELIDGRHPSDPPEYSAPHQNSLKWLINHLWQAEMFAAELAKNIRYEGEGPRPTTSDADRMADEG